MGLFQFRNLPRQALMLVFGRAISTICSALTVFALDVWIYRQTGSFTVFALLAVSVAVPSLLFAPFAGVIVDRFPRKRLLVGCEILAGLAIVILLLAYEGNFLSPLVIGAVSIVLGLINTVSWPAAMASVTELTQEDQRARVYGIAETIGSATMIGAPMLSAACLVIFGLHWIIVLDIVSYFVSASIVMRLSFPVITPSDIDEPNVQRTRRAQFFYDAGYGFRWIVAHKNLLVLLLFFTVINFGASIMAVALTPYVLSFGGPAVVAACVGFTGAGALVGGVLFTATGGMKQHEMGVLIGALVSGVCMFGLGASRVPMALYIFAFFEGMCATFMNASSQTIWSNAVPVEMQGRVFAIRKMIAWGLNPVSILMSVPLVSILFTPLLSMSVGSWSIEQLWGSGQSGTLGVMISTCGFFTLIFALGILVTNGLVGARSVIQDELS